MKIQEIIAQHLDKLVDKHHFLIVKSPCVEHGRSVFSIVYRSGDNFAQDMQHGYCPVVYPEAQDYEFVAIEMHHPHNDIFRKYNINPKYPLALETVRAAKRMRDDDKVFKQAIKLVLNVPEIHTAAKLAEVLEVTDTTIRNYASGRSAPDSNKRWLLLDKIETYLENL